MAAVDLGSNSFHMVVARMHHGQLAIVDRLREMVRLASGLSGRNILSNESQDRALGCLRRFGQRLRDMHASKVRVVGTNTLRKARNADSFLGAAEDALGHPVEIISGMEEARLIYQGVSHHTVAISGANLVIDIGGGSTELIIGEGYEPRRLESLAMGCVGLSQRFFESGRLSKKRFDKARLAVQLELQPVRGSFQSLGWERAIGSSGTIRAAADIALELGLGEGYLTLSDVEKIIEKMIEARRVDNLKLPGLSPDRAQVFSGGIAILVETLRLLDIDRLSISDGALREGLLYDMLGRLQHKDVREQSILGMQRRYHVDEAQAVRVETMALTLHGKVAAGWDLEAEEFRLLLSWASRLHEVGLDIAHSKYHLHGGYLLANADLPGFSRIEQQLLAKLVGFHRRKLEGFSLRDVPQSWQQPLLRLLVLLRLAVLLNRSRSPIELPASEFICGTDSLEIHMPRAWFADNPLTQADLTQEQAWLEEYGFELRLSAMS